MKYDEIVAKQNAYNGREEKWLDDLYQAALDLRSTLILQLGLMDTVYSDDEKIPSVKLIESQVEISEAAPLVRRRGLPFNDDGSLPFAIELKLHLEWGASPLYIFLGVRILDGVAQYSAWHQPHVLRPKAPQWVGRNEMLAQIDSELHKFYDHDPSAGSRSDCFIW